MTYSTTEQAALLKVALASIKSGLQTGHALQPDIGNYPPALTETRASFVTLKHDDTLRGCIGSLEPLDRLVSSVATNAYAAAFRDPRFPALTAPELAGLTIQLSVLGTLQVVECDSETDLLRQLQTGIDGWVIQERDSRGTFLPSVWEALPDPRLFLEQLKRKAGLAADYWSDTIEVWRYSTESFSASVEEIEKDLTENIITE
jgi:AmmeMemoRadiSam system protein A